MPTAQQDDALSALQLLAAMYPLPGELVFGDAAAAALAVADAGDEPVLAGVEHLEAVVRVRPDDAGGAGGEPEGEKCVELSVALPLIPGAGGLRWALRQPDFLPRAAFEELAAALPQPCAGENPSDAIMGAIEALRAALPDVLAAVAASAPATPPAAAEEDDGPLERVWFWFPSLSTREKRKDLVTYAARYRLTGFVLSGKPALLCLEGGGRAVDRYMGAIKSESWGDIPSYQKKVTERLRLPLTPAERKFTTMKDITHLITHHGTYNHRGDMSEVKRLMDQWGVGEDFAGAVMNAS